MKRFNKTDLLNYIEEATKDNNDNKLSLCELAEYINNKLYNDYTDEELFEMSVTDRVVRYYVELYDLKTLVKVRTNKKKYTRKNTSV